MDMETKEPLYRRVLALREEARQAQRRYHYETALLRLRIATAYETITGRGQRRAQKDPVYAIVRQRIIAKAADEETTDPFEQLEEDDFLDLIDKHPNVRDRLLELAHEFAIAVRPGALEERKRARAKKEEPEEEEEEEETRPAEPAPELPLWARLRVVLSGLGINEETIGHIIEETRKNPTRKRPT